MFDRDLHNHRLGLEEETKQGDTFEKALNTVILCQAICTLE